jgi:hypothetical protein
MATLQPFSRSPKRRNANAINTPLHTAQQNAFELSLHRFRSTLKNYNNQNHATKNSPTPLTLTTKLNSRQRSYTPPSPLTPKPFPPLTPPLTPTEADQSSDAPHENNTTKPPLPKAQPSPLTPKPFPPLTPRLTPTDADQSSDAPHANNTTKPPLPKPHPSLDPLRS